MITSDPVFPKVPFLKNTQKQQNGDTVLTSLALPQCAPMVHLTPSNKGEQGRKQPLLILKISNNIKQERKPGVPLMKLRIRRSGVRVAPGASVI
jgi:hypothetical protein